MISSLWASGSISLPNVVTARRRRAMWPSSLSVTAARANTTAASTSPSGVSSSSATTITGTARMRSTVSTLGRLIGNIGLDDRDRCQYPAIDVRPLPSELHRDAARLLADAFRDYPAWLAIASRCPGPRWRTLERFYRGALARAHDHGAVLAAGDGGRPAGVAIAYLPERWPPPAASFWHEAWGVALAGP